MAIVNRDLDTSQQKDVIYQAYKNVGVGSTILAGGASFWIGAAIPYPFTVESAEVYAIGLTGAPQIRLIIDRFAAGQTRMVCGISNCVITAYGTSGIQGLSGLAPVGSTLLNGQAKDQLSFDLVGANTGATDLTISVVIKKTQDIVSYNGL